MPRYPYSSKMQVFEIIEIKPENYTFKVRIVKNHMDIKKRIIDMLNKFFQLQIQPMSHTRIKKLILSI